MPRPSSSLGRYYSTTDLEEVVNLFCNDNELGLDVELSRFAQVRKDRGLDDQLDLSVIDDQLAVAQARVDQLVQAKLNLLS